MHLLKTSPEPDHEQKRQDVPLVHAGSSKAYIHAREVHLSETPSILSRESRLTNFRGFLNLSILLLIVNLLRLIIENFQKYGLLAASPVALLGVSTIKSFVGWLSLHAFHCTVAVFVEKLRLSGDGVVAKDVLMVSNLAAILTLPPFFILSRQATRLLDALILILSLILFMKLVSYHAVNGELFNFYPRDPGARDTDHTVYPQNITISNMLYFWLAPTLCYQVTYPKCHRIRKMFVVKRFTEGAAALAMMYLLIQQYAVPTARNAIRPLNELNYAAIMERILKMSVPCLYIWLLGFYAFFHAIFNVTGELMYFADRTFYRDWWNANSLAEYWRLWNIPVYVWLKRHIYAPLRAKGYSSRSAQVVIFIISAFFHEYLIAIPTKVFKGWALVAMLSQIPLIWLSSLCSTNGSRSSFGNIFFWILFCIVGQPMCVLFYYWSWTLMHPL